jgi:2-polyprenyl-6-methoxyphenol hydroxylase-like FAD-dependent oxidoreductase
MRRPESILILGGGTAGWMAACLFQHHWGHQGTAVQVIESSEIGIIGVGEGSTPQLKIFFDRLGVTEAEWMPRCNATYKTGIEFVGWSQHPGHEQYFHPFPTRLDRETSTTFFAETLRRRRREPVRAHPDAFYLSTWLAQNRRAPGAVQGQEFGVSYGYHFDAHLVGSFLREVAERRGVVRIEAKIANLEIAENGDVSALIAADGRRFSADLFIDCSGFHSVIVGGALGEPHVSFADNLFNDRAIVFATEPERDWPPCATRATALEAGWAWRIPLTNRCGNGYVFSSRFKSPERAEIEFRRHAGVASDVEARHLPMKIGRLDRCWVRNALAVGLAQGFVEPLEATALHVVLTTVETFISTLSGLGDTERSRNAFNALVSSRIEGIRDYLVCHYKMAQRRDTDYWRAASNVPVSASLDGILKCWFAGQDLSQEIVRQRIGRNYSSMSWHAMLAGYGVFPPLRSAADAAMSLERTSFEPEIVAAGVFFPEHGEALERLRRAHSTIRRS